eukprot:COSAG06_NODE_769_length_12440_cov_7.241796_9_plen_87_part_00
MQTDQAKRVLEEVASGAGKRKTGFLFTFDVNTIISPRQARDRYQENSPKQQPVGRPVFGLIGRPVFGLIGRPVFSQSVDLTRSSSG